MSHADEESVAMDMMSVVAASAHDEDMAVHEHGAPDASTGAESAALFDYASYTAAAATHALVASDASVADAYTASSDAITMDVHGANTVVSIGTASASDIIATGITTAVPAAVGSPMPPLVAIEDKTPTPPNHADAVDPSHVDKKTGRPSHPAWDHFVRGPKRNRFHHHAYCNYCTAQGVEVVPVRGVSGNMIRHLQKCIYCPQEIVAELRVLCAQKDAVNFNKRHYPHPSQSQPLLPADSVVSGIIQATAAAAAVAAAAHGVGQAAPTKKLKRTTQASFIPSGSGSNGGAATVAATPATSSTASSGHVMSTPQVVGDPVQQQTFSSLAMEMAPRGGLSSHSHPQEPPTDRSIQAKSKFPSSAGGFAATHQATAGATAASQQQPLSDQAALDRLVLQATLSGALPWDWMSVEEATRHTTTSGQNDNDNNDDDVAPLPRMAIYDPTHVAALSSSLLETQLARVKEELCGAGTGVTMAINCWFNQAERTHVVLFSLVNPLGETTAWRLLDVGAEAVVLDDLASQIRLAVVALAEEGVPLIAIVTDSLMAYAAAKAAITGASSGRGGSDGGENDAHSAIAVLPSFEAFLVNALGVILTISDSHIETMGHVIELVAAFSNVQLRDTLRRECGDPEAALVLPAKDKWFSFIDCIDSVRQFEDMIKIIGLRAVIHQSNLVNDAAANGKTTTAAAVSAASAADAPPAHVLETIQNPQFWENVVSLSELMSPIKETYKLMISQSSSSSSTTPNNATGANANANATAASSASSTGGRSHSSAVMTFSLSNVFYQLGRMHQQYTAIMADWEENPSGSRIVGHVRYLKEQVNKTWKLYDQPLMLLAFTLNYNMTHGLLARNLPAIQWLSIGKYAKDYFRRWFCSPTTSSSSGPPASSTSSGSGPRYGSRHFQALTDEAESQFLEDVLAFKERKYPFDSDSVCGFENPRSFYLLISDSNPLMHLFGTRLFSLATSAPQLAGGIVPNKSSITRVATSTCSHALLFPILQLRLPSGTTGWATSSKDLLACLSHTMATRSSSSVRKHSAAGSETEKDTTPPTSVSLLCGSDTRAVQGIWTDREWRLVAKQWKIEWEHEGNVGNVLDSVAGLTAASGGGDAIPSRLVSLDQIFKEKLPSRLQQSREEEAVVDV